MKSVSHRLGCNLNLDKSGSGSSLDSQEQGLVFQAGPGGDNKD